ncbi:MAG: HAD family phosphatase [Methylobacteriaceae bacterium]|nr:HAD family phosphatase [Methylobacteriaceae bacterium]
MAISLIVFDMDDVLCRYDVGARLAALEAAAGVAAATIEAAIWRSDYFAKADSGLWSAAECLAEFSRRIGAPLSRAQWVATRRVAMTPFPDMLDLVAGLKRAGRAVALLSNNDLLAKETLGEIFPGLPDLFAPHAHVSAEFGLQKPDPAIFRALCARLGVAPAEAVFVDDLAENVAGARAAGLSAHVFAGRAGLAAALGL